MTYARSIAGHALLAALYSAQSRHGLMRIELLLLEIDCLQVWLGRRP